MKISNLVTIKLPVHVYLTSQDDLAFLQYYNCKYSDTVFNHPVKRKKIKRRNSLYDVYDFYKAYDQSNFAFRSDSSEKGKNNNPEGSFDLNGDINDMVLRSTKKQTGQGGNKGWRAGLRKLWPVGSGTSLGLLKWARRGKEDKVKRAHRHNEVSPFDPILSPLPYGSNKNKAKSKQRIVSKRKQE
jgi:hypothetical protein